MQIRQLDEPGQVLKTIYNRFARWSERGLWQNLLFAVAGERDTPEQVALDSSHVKIHRCASGRKRGAETQAIGVTKGGRNSKIHAVVDDRCRPWVFVLTPGNTADSTVAETCVSLIPGIAGLVADKGYDTDAFRAWLKKHQIKTVIPGKSNRKKRIDTTSKLTRVATWS